MSADCPINEIEYDESPMRIMQGILYRCKEEVRKFHWRCVNGFPRFSRGKHLVLMTQLKDGITRHYR